MILHLIRHPQPLIAPGVCYGHLDVDIDDPTSLAAALRARLPVGLPVYTSPLRRCLKLARLLDAAAVPDERLKEMHFGEWEGRSWRDIPRAEIDAWAANVLDFVPPGGESPRQMAARIAHFLIDVRADESVLVTHAGVIRQILAMTRRCSLSEVLEVPVAYGEELVLHFPSTWTPSAPAHEA